MHKKILACAAAAALVFGSGITPVQNSLFDGVSIEASADTLPQDRITWEEFIETALPAEEFIQFAEDNHIPYTLRENNMFEVDEDWSGILFEFYGVQPSHHDFSDEFYNENVPYHLVFRENLSTDNEEYIEYIILNNKAFVLGYYGSKTQFKIPETVAGYEVCGVSVTDLIGWFLISDYRASEYHGAMAASGPFGLNGTINELYVPRYITEIDMIYADEFSNVDTLLVNADSAALEYAIENDIPYEIVPDDFEFDNDSSSESTPDTSSESTPDSTADSSSTAPSSSTPANNSSQGGGNGGQTVTGGAVANTGAAAGTGAIATLLALSALIVVKKKNK